MNTEARILEFIKNRGRVRAEDLRREFDISRVTIHKILLSLQNKGFVSKSGKSPIVFYFYKVPTSTNVVHNFSQPEIKFVNENYLYISPSGNMIRGIEGFENWIKNTNQEKYIEPLVKEFIKTRSEANKFKNSIGLINATEKLKNTFTKLFVDKVYFADFYSLPKFGKTILGQKILYSKQAQLPKLIKEIAIETSPQILNLIKKLKIDSVAFIPPTIPRKIQFLKEFENDINLPLPKIILSKAYPGDIPVAQKTLNKLPERIDNAKNTIFVKDQQINYKNILIVDDAVGSGSTINEVATKIKSLNSKVKVYGIGIVGSFKGFDVISEV